MAPGENLDARRRRRKICLILSVLFVILIIVLIAVLVHHLLTKEETLKATFLQRCKKFNDSSICENIWETFRKAFVNKDSCSVPMQAYDPLIEEAPHTLACNKAMLWSKTKDVVHSFTQKRNCFQTLEDTLLGSVVDKLTWCGKNNSDEILTTGCPEYNQCENPVRSYWRRVSDSFASSACGNVFVMLNGSLESPFDTSSIFGSIEVKKLNAATVTSLTVLLIGPTISTISCTNNSLKELQNALAAGIQYECKEVSISQVEDCISDPSKPCESCF